jgi:hypothetical protein
VAKHESERKSKPVRKAYCKQRVKSTHLRLKYGLTPDEHQKMLSDRNNTCDLCTRTFETLEGRQGPHVDHCHATGKVRGILCPVCNRQLGVVESLERKGILDKTVEYMLKHREDSRGFAT